jgi:hypothetical protein
MEWALSIFISPVFSKNVRTVERSSELSSTNKTDIIGSLPEKIALNSLINSLLRGRWLNDK